MPFRLPKATIWFSCHCPILHCICEALHSEKNHAIPLMIIKCLFIERNILLVRRALHRMPHFTNKKKKVLQDDTDNSIEIPIINQSSIVMNFLVLRKTSRRETKWNQIERGKTKWRRRIHNKKKSAVPLIFWVKERTFGWSESPSPSPALILWVCLNSDYQFVSILSLFFVCCLWTRCNYGPPLSTPLRCGPIDDDGMNGNLCVCGMSHAWLSGPFAAWHDCKRDRRRSTKLCAPTLYNVYTLVMFTALGRNYNT